MEPRTTAEIMSSTTNNSIPGAFVPPAAPARHLRSSSARSTSSAPNRTATPTPKPQSLASLVTALLATKKQLGLPGVGEAVAVLASFAGDSSDFFLNDAARVRGILGETCLHRTVKGGGWEAVRRWIRRSREREKGEKGESTAVTPARTPSRVSIDRENEDKDVDISKSPVLRAVQGALDALGIQGTAMDYLSGPDGQQANRVNTWLETNAGISARTIVGTTPLHEACSAIPHYPPDSSNESAALIVKDLLDAGADPFLRDLFGLTPLHRACIAGNSEIIAILLGDSELARAQLAIADNHGNSALHVAAYHDHPAAVSLLLEKGADPDARDDEGGTALHDASEAGSVEAVRALLAFSRTQRAEKGPDGIRRRPLDCNTRDFQNRTALHVATTPAVASVLLENGAKLNALDVDGFTAFHRAAARGLVRLVEYFISLGVKVDHRSRPHRRTALHLACSHGSGFFKSVDCTVPTPTPSHPFTIDFPAVIRILLQAGAHADAHTHPHRNTPVHVCCSFRPSPPLDTDLERELKEWLDVLRLLLSYGRSSARNKFVGLRNWMGDTPLHLALVGGVAKVLLENGADPEVQNWRGETALNVAEAGGKEGVAKVLKSWIESGHKAPVEQVGHAGQQGPPPIPPRPGHELVRKSSLSGAKIAVEGGKKVNFADGVGRSGN